MFERHRPPAAPIAAGYETRLIVYYHNGPSSFFYLIFFTSYNILSYWVRVIYILYNIMYPRPRVNVRIYYIVIMHYDFVVHRFGNSRRPSHLICNRFSWRVLFKLCICIVFFYTSEICITVFASVVASAADAAVDRPVAIIVYRFAVRKMSLSYYYTFLHRLGCNI